LLGSIDLFSKEYWSAEVDHHTYPTMWIWRGDLHASRRAGESPFIVEVRLHLQFSPLGFPEHQV